MVEKWKTSLVEQADENAARTLSRFFKTGPGEYGEGDRFLGLTVPKVRAVSKTF
ncbi:MAG: DNA alkylation repair protein, partial [Paramuribaculum sp.]|nr:DNA alkylation repair protein [Paramuribaculum sp.]